MLKTGWRILNVDLEADLPDLRADPGAGGVLTVFWINDRPVGHVFVRADELPMSGGAVREKAGALPKSGDPELLPAPGRTAQASIAICTRDRTEALERCLVSLTGLPSPPLEILVVDNAPQIDVTRRLVERTAGTRYVPEPRPGLDIARNTAIRHAAGQYIVFADDDVLVHPQWLERLLAGFDAPDIMAVTGLVLPMELDTEAQFLFETFWGFNKGYRRRDFGRDFFVRTRAHGSPAWDIGAGASMAFRREAFDHVGEFDDRLDAGAAGCSGDSEMWYRLVAEGWRCRYEPSAVSFHQHRREMDEFNRQIHAYMRGHVAALLIQFERYRHWGNLRRMAATLPAGYLRLVLRRLRYGPEPRTRTLGPEIAGCLSGIGFYLRNARPRRPREATP